jgi:hypothetical protein
MPCGSLVDSPSSRSECSSGKGEPRQRRRVPRRAGPPKTTDDPSTPKNGVFFDYSVTPTQFSLIATDGVLVFEKVTPMGNGAFVFGCWQASDGLFHPMPLADLP